MVSLSRRIKLLLLSSCLRISCATNVKVNSNKLFSLCLCEAFAMTTSTTRPAVSKPNHLRVNCHEIWDPQPPETLRACPGLWIALTLLSVLTCCVCPSVCMWQLRQKQNGVSQNFAVESYTGICLTPCFFLTTTVNDNRHFT
jgi:hypothetical protein